MRFIGLGLHEPVPDAKTIWLYREQLVRAGALKRLFARFDRELREKGHLAMGGQIVDATIIEARRPRLTEAEKATIKGGGVPAEWKPARRGQIDRDGRWTLKRGKEAAGSDCRRRAAAHGGERDRDPGLRLQEPHWYRPLTGLCGASPSLMRPPRTAENSAGCSTPTIWRAVCGPYRL
jgi:hypothetical protein